MAEQQAKEFVLGSAVHKVDKQQPWKRQVTLVVMHRATHRAIRRARPGSSVGTVI